VPGEGRVLDRRPRPRAPSPLPGRERMPISPKARLRRDGQVRDLSQPRNQRGLPRDRAARARSYLRDSISDSHFARTVIQNGCWLRRPASMAKALDLDLRRRLVAAVEAG